MKNYQKQFSGMVYFLPVVLFLFAFTLQSRAQETKRYHVESGKVTYKINSPEGKGTKVLIFDSWGMRESVRETIQKNGRTVKDQLTILNNGKSYAVNMLTKEGEDMSETSGMAMRLGGKDMTASGKKMLESMGGKMTGTVNFLGKNCEKWEVHTMGTTTILVWKGLTLKTTASVMGIKNTEEAVSVKTGLSFSDSDFEPPAGVKISVPQGQGMGFGDMQMSNEDKQQMDELMKMSYSDFKKKMKEGNPDLTDEEIKQSYDLMHKMGDIFK